MYAQYPVSHGLRFHKLLGNTSLKKECFLSGIVQITSPPNSGNLVLFFGRQKQRFARMTENAMIIMMVILMIMMTKMTKKHTNIKSFG